MSDEQTQRNSGKFNQKIINGKKIPMQIVQALNIPYQQ